MTSIVLCAGLSLGLSMTVAHAQSADRHEFFRRGESFVARITTSEMDADTCGVRLSNGSEKGAITFVTINAPSVPFPVELIYGHELGTGATHGARKADPYEVRVDGELLAVGTLEAGVAPYEGYVDEWPGALLDGLAYGKEFTWGFPGREPLIAVKVPDNTGMVQALIKCERS